MLTGRQIMVIRISPYSNRKPRNTHRNDYIIKYLIFVYSISFIIFMISVKVILKKYESYFPKDDKRFEKLEAKNGKPYFNLKATNGQLIGTSEMYESVASRDNGIESVKKNAPDASVDDQTA